MSNRWVVPFRWWWLCNTLGVFAMTAGGEYFARHGRLSTREFAVLIILCLAGGLMQPLVTCYPLWRIG